MVFFENNLTNNFLNVDDTVNVYKIKFQES